MVLTPVNKTAQFSIFYISFGLVLIFDIQRKCKSKKFLEAKLTIAISDFSEVEHFVT